MGVGREEKVHEYLTIQKKGLEFIGSFRGGRILGVNLHTSIQDHVHTSAPA